MVKRMKNEVAVLTLPAVNRVIRSIGFEDIKVKIDDEESWGCANGETREALVIVLESGWRVVLVDRAGQSCCESRYMSTDDDLDSLVGETLVGIRHGGADSKTGHYCGIEDGEIGDGEDNDDNEPEGCYCDGVVEVEFALIQTNRDSATIGTYNSHNGYYGGLDLALAVYDPDGNKVVDHVSFTGE